MQHLSNAELFKLYQDATQQMSDTSTEMMRRGVDWQHLASYGLYVPAIKTYRLKYNTELREAHDAVRAFSKQLTE